ncbi:MAG: YkgJ family cysteine cluster protein [Labilithrix sp.]|nr:YkgJ family cysteine cluster protein [Labilithrix sp.]
MGASHERERRQSSTKEPFAALREIFAQVDALMEGWSCDASTDCCRFGVTGREPYPTAVELAMLEHAVKARGGLPKRRSLPVSDERRCPLLSDAGACLVYRARPFGCRTFFCERARGPAGEPARALPRGEIARLGRDVADLSARFAPGDPGPRPLSRALRGMTTMTRRR